ncbi:MAG: hypothetical protein ACREBP_02380 [Sphingomicrobium sp.]
MSSLTLPPKDAETTDQAEWWKDCSTAQLKEIVAVGVAAGDRFDNAVREIERRSSESRSLVEAREAERKQREAKRDRKMRLAVIGGALALVILAGIVFGGWI